MVQNKAETGNKRRGRPRAYDPDTALRQVTGAFWKSGYSGTSLDQIVAATGMNRPSLSAAFGDKHALYLAALRGYWDQKFATMHDALAGGTLEEALMRAYEAALSLYFSGEGEALGCFVVGTAITEAPQDAEIRETVLSGFRALDAGFEARIRLASEAGELTAGVDPKVLAMLASGLMQTIALRARAGMPREELSRLARDAVKVICR